MTVPSGATGHAIQEWLEEHHPDLALYYNITTLKSASVGAYLLTAGLGDNRLGLGVESLVLVGPDGVPRYIDGPDLINALRGTAGLCWLRHRNHS